MYGGYVNGFTDDNIVYHEPWTGQDDCGRSFYGSSHRPCSLALHVLCMSASPRYATVLATSQGSKSISLVKECTGVV